MVIELKQSDYPGRPPSPRLRRASWWTMLPDGRIEIHKAAFHRAGAAGTRARQMGSPNGRESGSERVKRPTTIDKIAIRYCLMAHYIGRSCRSTRTRAGRDDLLIASL